MFTRRSFFGMVLGGLAGLAALLRAGTAAARKLAVKLDKVPALEKVGGSAILKLGGTEVLLIRETDTRVRALDPICTHAACYVAYNAGSGKVECGCHKSGFDLEGRVLYGPAPAPLKRFDARLDGDRIVVEVP
jgi:Rieske Fe-S protein